MTTWIPQSFKLVDPATVESNVSYCKYFSDSVDCSEVRNFVSLHVDQVPVQWQRKDMAIKDSRRLIHLGVCPIPD